MGSCLCWKQVHRRGAQQAPQPSTCLGVRGGPGGGVRGPSERWRATVTLCSQLVNAAQCFRGWEGEGKMCVWSSPSYIFFRFAETKQLPLTRRMSCFFKKRGKDCPQIQRMATGEVRRWPGSINVQLGPGLRQKGTPWERQDTEAVIPYLGAMATLWSLRVWGTVASVVPSHHNSIDIKNYL